MILDDAGYQVVQAADGSEGLTRAASEKPAMILCDVRMPEMDGLEFLCRYRESGGQALVMVMTAYGSSDLAVEAMKKGAYDYIPKPFGADEVVLTVRKAEERENLRREVGRLRSEVRADRRFGDLVARSSAMLEALEVATKVAPHESPVLLSGQSGTGKELVARLIHRESRRADGPFVPVNCGAIPANLLESEFFGHVKGAFTGADRDRVGLFETARGGTLFLDEVGELPGNLQVKLLRVVQERQARAVGSDRSAPVDVRIVAATNRDLEEAVADGSFRQDLYYRLAVVPIHLPALLRRAEEIPELARYFLDRHRERMGIEIEGISPEAMKVLLSYPWPGNVRELENVLERALVLTDGPKVSVQDLPAQVRNPSPIGMAATDDDDLSVKRRLAELERLLIQRALERTSGNKTQAAELLELSPRALRYKIQDYGLA
ncbi:MAG: sigma-54 dependent transcriptional regulator [Gemmatimonadetes bacterium]|nr:sigma-54 dependent transcriptional regulator [Gemmatimonadota bacterium]MBT8402512.1 sigma-54 dependent transcriptional regulator [Gemmatimonadota bacterium]